MEDITPELSMYDQDGVILLSFGEEMKLDVPEEDCFASRKRIVPGFGNVHLWISKESKHPDAMGITIIGDQIVIKPAQELEDKGLYELTVVLEGLPESADSSLTRVGLKIPAKQIELTSRFWFGEDAMHPDPDYHYYAHADKWEKSGDQQVYPFFVPNDHIFLRGLRFSFSSGNPKYP